MARPSKQRQHMTIGFDAVERVDIPLHTAELILERCQSGVQIVSTILLPQRAPGWLGWLEQIALNCYTQGLMDGYQVATTRAATVLPKEVSDRRSDGAGR